MRVSTCVIVNILFIANLLVASPGHGQSAATKLIDLELSNIVLKKAFKVIENKADVVIMYKLTPKTVNEKIDIKVTQTSLSDILDLLLKGKNLKWTIRENVIRIEEALENVTTGVDLKSTPSLYHSLTTPPITVRGRLLNENQEPVIASITVKETGRGATSDAEGFFELTNVSDDATLVISATNLETIEVKVNHRTVVNVSVKTKFGQEKEVVVNGGYYWHPVSICRSKPADRLLRSKR